MKNTARKLASGVALTASAALLLAGCAGVENSNNGNEGGSASVRLEFSSFLGNTTPQAKTISWMIENIEQASNGEIQIEEFWAASLLDGTQTLEGTADGRTDIGHMTVLYNPSELPLSQVVAIPFVTSDVVASENTFNELYRTNADFKAEWDNQGVYPLLFIGVAPSLVAAKEEITGFDWLSGKTLRATGYIAAALQKAGANPVAIETNEIYEAVQRGTIDGFSNNILDTIPVLSLQEVSPWVAETGVGNYTVNAIVINKAKWDSLSAEHQQIIQDAANQWQEYYMEQLGEVEDEACRLLIENGGGSTVWSDADIQQWKELVGDDALNKWKSDAQASGADVDAFYDEYISLVQGYEGDYVNGMVRCADTTAQQ